jgi:hypothetical protein
LTELMISPCFTAATVPGSWFLVLSRMADPLVVSVGRSRAWSALDVGELLGHQPVADREEVDPADVAVGPPVRPSVALPGR